MKKLYSVQNILELSCAAFRVNGAYLKETSPVNTADGKFLYLKYRNKDLIKYAIGVSKILPEYRPLDLVITDEDSEKAEEIRKYYRKLMFAAVIGENDFHTTVNKLLFSEEMPPEEIGFIACLPSVYIRDEIQNRVKKQLREVVPGYLAPVATTILDKDCNILESARSKNFDAWNITAIVDTKLASWFSKTDLILGDCVLIKAKVKDHSMHYFHKMEITRLNYVQAAQ
jgi:hypothetical protein